MEEKIKETLELQKDLYQRGYEVGVDIGRRLGRVEAFEEILALFQKKNKEVEGIGEGAK